MELHSKFHNLSKVVLGQVIDTLDNYTNAYKLIKVGDLSNENKLDRLKYFYMDYGLCHYTSVRMKEFYIILDKVFEMEYIAKVPFNYCAENKCPLKGVLPRIKFLKLVIKANKTKVEKYFPEEFKKLKLNK